MSKMYATIFSSHSYKWIDKFYYFIECKINLVNAIIIIIIINTDDVPAHGARQDT